MWDSRFRVIALELGFRIRWANKQTTVNGELGTSYLLGESVLQIPRSMLSVAPFLRFIEIEDFAKGQYAWRHIHMQCNTEEGLSVVATEGNAAGKTQKALLRDVILELMAHPLPLFSWFHYLSCTSHWISHRVPNWEYLSRKTAVHCLLFIGSWLLDLALWDGASKQLSWRRNAGAWNPAQSWTEMTRRFRVPNFWRTYSLSHDRERKVYEPTPAGGITIVVIVYDEDESYGLWLNTQRHRSTMAERDAGKHNLFLQNHTISITIF